MRWVPLGQELPVIAARPACVGRLHLRTSSAEINLRVLPMVRPDLRLSRRAPAPQARSKARGPTARPTRNRTPTAAKALSIPHRPVAGLRIGTGHRNPTNPPPRSHPSVRDLLGRLRRTPMRMRPRSGLRRHWPRRRPVGAAVAGLSRRVLVDRPACGRERTPKDPTRTGWPRSFGFCLPCKLTSVAFSYEISKGHAYIGGRRQTLEWTRR
jgi:hypothetical protein